MKKLFLILFLAILLVGTVSAETFTFDNIKQYDEETKIVTVVNTFGLGRDIATIQLNTPLDYYVGAGYQKVAEFTINNLEDYSNPLKKLELYDLKKDEAEITRSFDYKYKIIKIVDVNDYKTVCQDKVNLNGTKYEECSQEIIGTHKEERITWEDLPTELPLGVYTIGIFTDVQIGDRVEWIPTYYGIKIKSWAIWTAYLNTDLVAYWRFDEGTGTNVEDVVTGTHNGTCVNCEGDEWGTGIIGNAICINKNLDNSEVVNITGESDFDGIKTISLWINYTSTGVGSKIIITKRYAGSYKGGLSYQTILEWYDVNGTIFTFGTGISTGVWHHLVAVMDGTNRTFYIDGVQNATFISSTATPWNTADNVNIAGGEGVRAMDGMVDEVGLWDRVLSSAEVTQLYNGGTGITYDSSPDSSPTITLNSPIDVFNSSSQTITFNGTVFDDINLINVSLILNSTYNQTNSSGLNNSDYIFSLTLVDGLYNWTYEACDDANQCINATVRDFLIDSIFPNVEITYPIDFVDYQANNTNLIFNWTVSDTNLDSCWYDYANTNTSTTCSHLNDSVLITNFGDINLTLWVNDTAGNTNSSFVEWDYKVFQNSVTYNSTSYETITNDPFVLNISSDGSQTVTAVLHYNGTEYASTKTGDNSEMTFTNTVSHATGDLGNKSFYWNVTHGSDVISTNTYYQNVGGLNLTICQAAPQNVTYVNFTFVDEESLSTLNATIDSSTWSYWLGDGTYTKSLLFSNNTLNYDYGFCLTPGNVTIHNTRSIQYASTGYPQRKYDASGDLTNTTTNTTLYLLSSADGIYTSIHVIDQVTDNIIGAEVTAERQFSGVWTVIGQEETDDAGSVTFWVNPDYDHRFTFVKDGCTGITTTIRPTQTLYTQQLQCAGSVELTEYTSPYEGIEYSISPKAGTWLPENTIYAFTFNITASLSNLVSYSMNITDKDGTQLNSTQGITSTGGNLTVLLDTTDYGRLYGYYYMDIGNGTYLIDPSVWIIRDIEVGRGSVYAFFINLKASEPDIEDNYNSLMLLFFILFIVMAAFTYSTGVEMSQPGICLIILFFFVAICSIAGYFTIDFAPSDFMNKYGVLLITFFLTGGFFLGKWAQT